jgi:hypothetical protein
MTTRFVRTTGNDTTGNGTTGNPYASLSRAMVFTTSGDSIAVGNGTYQENTSSAGYWNITKVFTSYVTIYAENTASPDVTIQGSTSTSNVRVGGGANYYHFVDIKFVGRTTGSVSAFGLNNSDLAHYIFDRCTFQCTSAADATSRYAFNMAVSTANALSDFTFNNCTFILDGIAGSAAEGACIFNHTDAAATVDGITFNNCTAISVATGLLSRGVTNLTVNGGYWYGGNSYGICHGVDGVPTGSFDASGTIHDALISSVSSHGLLSALVYPVVASYNNIIYGGDQGFVLKECANVVAHDNTIIGGSQNVLYFKAAHDCTAYNNVAIANRSGASALTAGSNVTSGNKVYNLSVTHNRFFAYGGAVVQSWAGSAEDNGGNVCDYNEYHGGFATTKGVTTHNLGASKGGLGRLWRRDQRQPFACRPALIWLTLLKDLGKRTRGVAERTLHLDTPGATADWRPAVMGADRPGGRRGCRCAGQPRRSARQGCGALWLSSGERAQVAERPDRGSTQAAHRPAGRGRQALCRNGSAE